jgi:hypothetical protein
MLVLDCRDPRSQAAFWAKVLSYEMTERNRDEFKVSDRGGQVPTSPVLHARARIKGSQEPAASRSGDRRADGTRSCTTDRSWSQGHRCPLGSRNVETPDTWTVMQEPEGNEFCVTSWTTFTGWS